MKGAGHTIRTGDLAYKNAEGFYFLKGRKDEMIIVGGENLFPVELEEVACRHPQVVWAKAEGFKDEHGNGQLVLRLCFDGAVSGTEQFMEWLAPQIPKHIKPAVIEVLEQPPLSKLL